MFLLRKRFWLTIVKLIVLAVVALLGYLQVPELRYDLGPKTPKVISGLDELQAQPLGRPTFATVVGEGDYDKAFVYKTHGLAYTYYLLKPYGEKLVVRTYEKVTEEWRKIVRAVGRLRGFHRLPFSRTVRAAFKSQFDVDIPADAYFLARDDVPKLSAWQVSAEIFVIVVWVLLLYFFFLRRRKTRRNVDRGDTEVTEG